MYNGDMKVLILGGNSPHHRDWIRQLGAHLEGAGHEVLLHDYHHWTTGESLADVDYELEQLAARMEGQGDYVVIAKSIGTVIAALGVGRGILTPSRCVLLGIPYDGIAGETPGFDDSLRQLPRTVVIQNEHDPFGTADVVAAHLETVQNTAVTLVRTPGDTHDYLDFPLIGQQLDR